MKEKNRKTKASAGFTLLEAVIALAIWMILSLSVFFTWIYITERTSALMARQNAFENARGSMDALVNNLQMARTIVLEVEGDYILRRLTLTQRDPDGRWHNYIFFFDISAPPGTAKHHRLEFGLNNEFASNIAMVRIQPISGGRHMHITVITDCDYPTVLEGQVDIRFKELTVIRR